MTEKILAIIPARGGSKGIKNKNIKLLNGKPLIYWTISTALKSKLISKTIVSTDSAQIAKVAEELNCEVPFLRPSELSSDEATSSSVISYILDKMRGYDYVVMLQPTSPLRTVEDIENSINLMKNMNSTACVSLVETSSNPYWMYTLDKNKNIINVMSITKPISRRQDLPLIYQLNGAIYISKVKEFVVNKTFFSNETIGYVMPKDRSIDIDNIHDFLEAEQYMKNNSW